MSNTVATADIVIADLLRKEREQPKSFTAIIESVSQKEIAQNKIIHIVFVRAIIPHPLKK